MYREPGGEIPHPFITPGSAQYCDVLWDWDSWLTDVALRDPIRKHCWDERDGFYYSVDLNLIPCETQRWTAHSGQVRDWPCLIQRIGVWSGFMTLWAGLATPEQADRIVKEHCRDRLAPRGVSG
jgi:neutral trehalase